MRERVVRNVGDLHELLGVDAARIVLVKFLEPDVHALNFFFAHVHLLGQALHGRRLCGAHGGVPGLQRRRRGCEARATVAQRSASQQPSVALVRGPQQRTPWSPHTLGGGGTRGARPFQHVEGGWGGNAGAHPAMCCLP